MTPTWDSFALRQAACHARLLVRTAGFPAHDFDDLCQELLVDLLRRSPRFDARRGEWGGFVRGVVRNHATILATRRYRRAQHEVLADDAFKPGPKYPVTLEELHFYDPISALDLRLDVARVVSQLPTQLQLLASLLCVISVCEVAL